MAAGALHGFAHQQVEPNVLDHEAGIGGRDRGDHLLVLLKGERADGIDQNASPAYQGRDAGEDLPLQRREAWNVLGPAAPAELGVTA